ncbi:MAG: hypothetical protein ACK4SA_06150 [Caldilinea sp.]
MASSLSLSSISAGRALELGMKFGVHVAIVQMAPDAPAAIEHPERLAFGGDYYGVGAICYGAFHCSRAAGKVIVAQGEGGRIINVSSVNGFWAWRSRAITTQPKAQSINCRAV